MDLILLSEFVPTMRQWVDVPLPMLVEQAVLKACQEFCRKSKVVIYPRTFDRVFACQTVEIIGGSSLARSHQGAVKSADVLQVVTPDGALQAGLHYHAISLDQIRFLGEFENVTVLCALEPTHQATAVPKVLFDDHLDGICAGAAASLLMQEGEWGDPRRAGILQAQFVESHRQATRFRLEATPEVAFSNPVRRRNREFF